MKYFEIHTSAGFSGAIHHLNIIYITIKVHFPELEFIITDNYRYINLNHCIDLDFFKLFGLDKFYKLELSNIISYKISKKEFNSFINDNKINELKTLTDKYECLIINSIDDYSEIKGYNIYKFPQYSIYNHINYIPSRCPFVTDKKRVLFHMRRDDILLGKYKSTVIIPPISEYLKLLDGKFKEEDVEIIICSDGLESSLLIYESYTIEEKKLIDDYKKDFENDYQKFIGKDPYNTIALFDCLYYADIIYYNFSTIPNRFKQIMKYKAEVILVGTSVHL